MKNILLVDDDLNFRRSLIIQLELEGYKVTDVGSAMEGISYLARCFKQNTMPEVVISDLRMFPMNGVSFVSFIREQYPDLAVVIISAFDLPPRLSGCAFVRKPFSLDDLIQQIQVVSEKTSPPVNGIES